MAEGFDCHVHVIDPARYPFASPVRRVPNEGDTATAGDLDDTLAAAGMEGALIVQASPYATDNAALLDALAASGGRHRGIAAVPLDATDADLDALGAAGVVGARLNLVNFTLAEVAEELSALCERLAARGWWAELQCRAPEVPAVAPVLAESGVRVLFDHCGYPDPTHGIDEPGFRTVLAFGREGRAAMKLSGAFRISQQPPPHADLDPCIEAVIDAFGLERCVWGSDYPFLWVPDRPSYSDTLATLARWLPDAADRRTVLRETPVALFGFAAAA